MNNILIDLKQFFNKEYYDPFLTKLENNVDYHKGDWYFTPLFIKNLCNFELIKDNYDPVELTINLKKLGFISATINKFSPGTEVFPHTDEDLVNSPHVMRAFIPLEENYKFNFSGQSFDSDNSFSLEDKERDSSILFPPRTIHSYKNTSKTDQYFIVADVAKEEFLSKCFWDTYLSISLKYYLNE